MSRARKQVDWEGMFAECLDPETARRMRAEIPSKSDTVCSMCGEFCAVKTINEIMKQ
jgi:phosphomethylpyrimidine synthase